MDAADIDNDVDIDWDRMTGGLSGGERLSIRPDANDDVRNCNCNAVVTAVIDDSVMMTTGRTIAGGGVTPPAKQ